MYTPTLNNVLDRMLALSKVADETAAERFFPSFSDAPFRAQMWLPLVDTYQTEKNFVIEADLPGVHPENVEISFENGVLTLAGTRAPTLPAKEKQELKVFTSERISGKFARSIRLPEQVDAEKIEATFSFGVLTVTVPKLASAQPRKIAINVTESAKKVEPAKVAEPAKVKEIKS
jgi:HSP20 family protein